MIRLGVEVDSSLVSGWVPSLRDLLYFNFYEGLIGSYGTELSHLA